MFLTITLLSGTAIEFRVGKQPKNYSVKRIGMGLGGGKDLRQNGAKFLVQENNVLRGKKFGHWNRVEK
jgi:hypothetical protein